MMNCSRASAAASLTATERRPATAALQQQARQRLLLQINLWAGGRLRGNRKRWMRGYKSPEAFQQRSAGLNARRAMQTLILCRYKYVCRH